jgi:RNA polymerase sigma-70 factor (ECF subfamily)
LFRIAKRLLVSAEEAQDASQEVLSKLWEKRAELKALRSIEAYAITMTKNYCLDRLKLKEASNLRLVHSNYESTSDTIQKTLEHRDQLDVVGEYLKTLPAQQQLLFQLREVEGMEYDEIETILDMKPTAIRVSLSRIRKQLRAQLLKMNSYGIS